MEAARGVSVKVPSEKQYGRLLILGAGAAVIAPGRRHWETLVRNGWVTSSLEDDGTGHYLPPLRITPAGLTALAEAVERYGLPELGGPVERLDEPAFIGRLHEELDEARKERDAARLEAHRATCLVRQIRRIVSNGEEPA